MALIETRVLPILSLENVSIICAPMQECFNFFIKLIDRRGRWTSASRDLPSFIRVDRWLQVVRCLCSLKFRVRVCVCFDSGNYVKWNNLMMGNSGSKQDQSCKTKSMKITNTADFLAAETEAEVKIDFASSLFLFFEKYYILPHVFYVIILYICITNQYFPLFYLLATCNTSCTY